MPSRRSRRLSSVAANTPRILGNRSASRWRGWLILGLVLTPALAAIWSSQWFVTQDGPAHLYNATILARWLDPHSPFRDFYELRLDPLPNWSGHFVLASLVSVLPDRVADRAMTTLTLLSVAVGTFWLKRRVDRRGGEFNTAFWATILGLNVSWLLGFDAFLIGLGLGAVTLGLWWSGRHAFGPRRAAGVSALLVLGYFSHLVSLGLTVIGLIVLAFATPGRRRARRIAWSAVTCIPLIPLTLIYLSISRRSAGRLTPIWDNLDNPASLWSWMNYATWTDPITIASKATFPLITAPSPLYRLAAPALWFVLGLMMLLAANLSDLSVSRFARARSHLRRGWLILGLLLWVGGLFGPDTLGKAHGHYLAQRVALSGLIFWTPWFDARGAVARRFARVASVCLGIALAVQTGFIWDYARLCERNVGGLLKAEDALAVIGSHSTRPLRVGSLILLERTRFRANPLYHADNLFGLPGRIVWYNYEAGRYYFPLRFKDHLRRPSPDELEAISILDGTDELATRGRRWETLLDSDHDTMDVLVQWGDDKVLDAINRRWFDPTFVQNSLTVYRRRSN